MRLPKKAKTYQLTKRITLLWAWFDLYIGPYWSIEKRRLYIIVVTLGFYIQFKPKEDKTNERDEG